MQLFEALTYYRMLLSWKTAAISRGIFFGSSGGGKKKYCIFMAYSLPWREKQAKKAA